jgi:hypothetical protein
VIAQEVVEVSFDIVVRIYPWPSIIFFGFHILLLWVAKLLFWNSDNFQASLLIIVIVLYNES